MKRIESLDHLRGLMALSVMVFHYVSWAVAEPDSGTLLGRLGIYAVSIFYILSGLSLGLVYHGRIQSVADIRAFAIKRVFRIFPIFWIAITAGVAARLVNGSPIGIPWSTLVLNYTLLFGFVRPGAYITTGAWSIGNEMVFYAVLPATLHFARHRPWLTDAVFVASLGIGAYFAFGQLDPSRSLADQWQTYINPFNQIPLFLSGVVISRYGPRLAGSMPAGAISVLLLGVLLAFWFWPSKGDLIQVVTGWNRVVLSALSAALVLLMILNEAQFTGVTARFLGFLGESCYSIYLLHPLVCLPVVFLGTRFGLGANWSYTVSGLTTLAVAALLYRHIERPMMDLGKRISSHVQISRTDEVVHVR